MREVERKRDYLPKSLQNRAIQTLIDNQTIYINYSIYFSTFSLKRPSKKNGKYFTKVYIYFFFVLKK